MVWFNQLRLRIIGLICLSLLVFSLAGCGQILAASPKNIETRPVETLTIVSTTNTPPPIQPTATVTATPVPAPLQVWLPDYLPEKFRREMNLDNKIQVVDAVEQANLRLAIQPAPSSSKIAPASQWIYAVAAAFPTPTDSVEIADLQKIWQGEKSAALGVGPLLVDPETRKLFGVWWGPAHPGQVIVVNQADLLEAAWSEQPGWAIIPFENIQPRWKILRIDGQSPLDNSFQPERYPLSVTFELTGEEAVLARLPSAISLPSNRDPNKLTVLMMTGVTALSRYIGAAMEEKGVNYPAQDIGKWLSSADLTHISNEVSFYTDCPKPGPQRADMRFCSHPKYIELLETVGTDIVELTGNHNLDWGTAAYLDTLEMYRQRDWKVYGGGANLTDARQPLLVEHNGNRLAFLGCSPAGPEKVWATSTKPGSASCNLAWIEQQVQSLSAEGYLPIVTFQAFEAETYLPPPGQGAPNFRRMARAGAVIVSGSQAHIPQTMTFVENSFVHYGLGNLFFDQMIPKEARQAFLDRHVFYDGQYLGVELLTTLLEENARPRPMTAAERAAFLEKLFSLSTWETQ